MQIQTTQPTNSKYLAGGFTRLPGIVPFYNYLDLNERIIEQQKGAKQLGELMKQRLMATALGELKPVKAIALNGQIKAQNVRDNVFLPSHPEPDQLNRWLVNPQDKARFRHALGGSQSPLLQPKMVFNIAPSETVIEAARKAFINQAGGKSFATIAQFDSQFLDPVTVVSIEEFSMLISSKLIPLPLYIKPTNSANGNGVIRISEEGSDLVFTMVKTVKQTEKTTEKVESYFEASGIATSVIDPFANISTFKIDKEMLDLQNILPGIIHDLWIIVSTDYIYEDKKENVTLRTMTVETEIEPIYTAGTHEIRLYIKGDLDTGECKLLKYKGEITGDGRCSVARFNGSRFSNYSGRGDFTKDAEYDQMLDPFIADCKIPKTKRNDLYEFIERAGTEAFRYLSQRYHSRGIDTYSTNEALMEIDIQLARAHEGNSNTFETPKGYTQAGEIEGYLLQC